MGARPALAAEFPWVDHFPSARTVCRNRHVRQCSGRSGRLSRWPIYATLRWLRHAQLRSSKRDDCQSDAGTDGRRCTARAQWHFPDRICDRSLQSDPEYTLYLAWLRKHLPDPAIPSALPAETSELSGPALYGMDDYQRLDCPALVRSRHAGGLHL